MRAWTAPLAVAGVLCALFGVLALLGPGDATAHWYWARLTARPVAEVVVIAAVAAALAHRFARPFHPAWVFCVGFLPYAVVAQAMPDTPLYAEHALRGAREGLVALFTTWPQAVWGAPDGAFHVHLPAVPAATAVLLSLGLPWRLGLAVWAAALVAGTTLLGGRRAALLLLGVPILWPYTGWLTTDVPCAAAVALGLAGLARGRLWWLLPALFVKVSALLFLAGPLLVAAVEPWRSRRRAAVIALVGLLAVATVFLIPRQRPVWTDLSGVRSLLLHMGPWLLLPALAGLVRSPPGADDASRRLRWLLAASMAGVLASLRLSPLDHVVRYALPALPAICAAAALTLGPRLGAAVAAFGLVLGLGLWRPLTVHTQAANLFAAIRGLDQSVQVVDVWSDQPRVKVPPEMLLPLIQLETHARVQYRGCTSCSEARRPGEKRRWWWAHPADPIFFGNEPAQATLLMTHSARPTLPPGAWTELSRHDRYRASSFIFPRGVLLLEAAQATGTAP